MQSRQAIIQTPHLASGGEIARHYNIHPQILKRWVERGCPTRRARRPYIYDLEQVEQWRREQGMEPVEVDDQGR